MAKTSARKLREMLDEGCSWRQIAGHVDRLKLKAIENFVGKVKAGMVNPESCTGQNWLDAVEAALAARRAEVSPAEPVPGGELDEDAATPEAEPLPS